MIGFLKGIITLKDGQSIYIDVNGVGYKVHATAEVLSKTSADSQSLIYTYTHVREDVMELFGFLHFEDLKLFEKLISVSGVGPKTAINIFSFGNKEQIMQAIVSGDVDFFTTVPRLGKKNAQKIIIELRSKIADKHDIDINSLEKDSNEDVIKALKSIGFSAREIQQATKSIKDNSIPVEEKIRLALKYLGK